jgi:hypothetical protein
MGGRHGKIAFVRSLRGLEDTALDFVEALGTIRNHAAHRVSNIEGFSLPAYLQTLDNGEFERLRRAIDRTFRVLNPNEIVIKPREGTDELPLSAREVFLTIPKHLIVNTLLEVLFSIDLLTEGAKRDLEARREFDDAARAELIRLMTQRSSSDGPS